MKAFLPTHVTHLPNDETSLPCYSNVGYPGVFVLGLNNKSEKYYVPEPSMY